MEKYGATDVELMKLLLELQELTSPIKLSIGYMENGEVKERILIQECAPKVVQTLVQKGYSCDLTPAGMIVYK